MAKRRTKLKRSPLGNSLTRAQRLRQRLSTSLNDVSDERLDSQELRRLQMFLCLVPVVGFFPALWTLYKGRGSRQEKAISRLAVTLALGWVIGYFLLNTGAQAAGGSTSLQLLVMSSLLTSGYFLTNIWLMVRLWQRKSVWLPGVSRLGDRLP